MGIERSAAESALSPMLENLLLKARGAMPADECWSMADAVGGCGNDHTLYCPSPASPRRAKPRRGASATTLPLRRHDQMLRHPYRAEWRRGPANTGRLLKYWHVHGWWPVTGSRLRVPDRGFGRRTVRQ